MGSIYARRLSMIAQNLRILQGIVTGEVLFGWQPFRWMLFYVKVPVVCYNRHASEYRTVDEPVVVQGKENVEAHQRRIKEGACVYALGQAVSPYVAMGDPRERPWINGNVLLASQIQVSDKT